METQKEIRPTANSGTDSNIFSPNPIILRNVEQPAAKAELVEESRDQYQVAVEFAREIEGHALFIHGLGWHVYDGARWSPEFKGVLAKSMILNEIMLGIKRFSDAEVERRIERDVPEKQLYRGLPRQSVRERDGIAKLLTELPGISFAADAFDGDVDVLNLQNGTYNLRTRELHPHDPNDRITKLANASYDPETPVRSDVWESFLTSTLPDEEIRNFLQEIIGLSLYGKQVEHVLPFLTGSGRNGKGTLYKAILHACGDYGDSVSNGILAAGRSNAEAPSSAVASLKGLRVAITSELNQNARFDAALTKQLTGNDEIRARHLYQEPFTFTPQFTLLFITNHLPELPADDPAMWERVVVIPFEQSFLGADQDKNLDDKLAACADAIIAWAIEGLNRYFERGYLEKPEVIADATNRYRNEVDYVSQFVTDVCSVEWLVNIDQSRLDTRVYVSSRVLFAAYRDWARQQNVRDVRIGRLSEFRKSLIRLGWEPARTNQLRYFRNPQTGQALVYRAW